MRENMDTATTQIFSFDTFMVLFSLSPGSLRSLRFRATGWQRLGLAQLWTVSRCQKRMHWPEVWVSLYRNCLAGSQKVLPSQKQAASRLSTSKSERVSISADSSAALKGFIVIDTHLKLKIRDNYRLPSKSTKVQTYTQQGTAFSATFFIVTSLKRNGVA